MIEKQQETLVQIMDLFTQRFDKRAILRGGMVLRLLGCERLTNDLDYLFVPYQSKKDIVDEVLTVLAEVEDATMTHSINSKCLRVKMLVDGTPVQIEAKVAHEASVIALSNALVARRYRLPPRLIAVVDHADSLANKMAAWNERRLARDLYDIWFYLSLGIRANDNILIERLKKPLYSKMIKKRDYFLGETVQDFYRFLSESVQVIDEDQMINELSTILPIENLAGIKMMILTSLFRLK